MYQINNIQLSRHAVRRCQQRGVKQGVLSALLDHHDVDRQVGGNCRVLRMSRKQARQEFRTMGPQVITQLENLAVIISETTGEIVTVFHDTGKSRRYRATA